MFKFKITWTNFIGATGFLVAIYFRYDFAITASVILILGKQVEPILKAWKGIE